MAGLLVATLLSLLPAREARADHNDPAAHDIFIGTSCGLCNHSSDYEYGEHGL